MTGIYNMTDYDKECAEFNLILTSGYEPSDDLVKELQEHVKKVTAHINTPEKSISLTPCPRP